MAQRLEQTIKEEARRLGFLLAGITTPNPPPHLSVFEDWLTRGRHASMDYLTDKRSRDRRADPRLILPECKSILILAVPYSAPLYPPIFEEETLWPCDLLLSKMGGQEQQLGRVAAYAWGNDYHIVLPERLEALVQFIENQVGHAVPNRWYTDTGPILERDLAQRAGLGWIGKNTCLIHPKHGSYFLLAEILLDLELETDAPFLTDQCGTCTRCIEACPTDCILPDRTIDAGRCLSYLTIELKEEIPTELRSSLGNWVFGCDICQMVCPWNRFAAPEGDPAFRSSESMYQPDLMRELELTPGEFNRKFKNSPIRRAKRRGYLRNAAVALGNEGSPEALPVLRKVLEDPESLVRVHAAWALERISRNE